MVVVFDALSAFSSLCGSGVLGSVFRPSIIKRNHIDCVLEFFHQYIPRRVTSELGFYLGMKKTKFTKFYFFISKNTNQDVYRL